MRGAEGGGSARALSRDGAVRGLQTGLLRELCCRPWPNQPGNGCHIHFSLWDPTGEHNLVHGEGRPHGISEFAEHFVAGLLDHLPGLVALTCPSSTATSDFSQAIVPLRSLATGWIIESPRCDLSRVPPGNTPAGLEYRASRGGPDL